MRAVGLAHPDLARVDDDLEQLVDRERRPPVVAPLLHVVREQGDRHAGGEELAGAVHDGPVDADRHLGHERQVRVHVDRLAEHLGCPGLHACEPVLERDLADLHAVPVVGDGLAGLDRGLGRLGVAPSPRRRRTPCRRTAARGPHRTGSPCRPRTSRCRGTAGSRRRRRSRRSPPRSRSRRLTALTSTAGGLGWRDGDGERAGGGGEGEALGLRRGDEDGDADRVGGAAGPRRCGPSRRPAPRRRPSASARRPRRRSAGRTSRRCRPGRRGRAARRPRPSTRIERRPAGTVPSRPSRRSAARDAGR